MRRESHVKATNKVRNPRAAGGGSSICVPFSLVSRRIIRGCVAPRMTTPHLLRVRAGRRVPGPVSEKHSIRGMRDLITNLSQSPTCGGASFLRWYNAPEYSPLLNQHLDIDTDRL